MDIRTTSLGIALAACLLPSAAHAGGPATTGALATKANRIVGTWLAVGEVSGANCVTDKPGPAATPRAYLMYHAGGTLTELPRLPSNAAQAARTFAVGNWYYDPASDTYYVSFRFDWYAGGVLQGHQTVDREIKLDDSGDSLSGSAVSVRYLQDGTEVYSQCGTGTATRL